MRASFTLIRVAKLASRLTLLFSLPSALLLRTLEARDDRTLVEGFIAGDEPRTRALLERLMPLLKQELDRRWPALKDLHADILAEIAVTLVTWRAEAREGDASKLRPDESLDLLSARLVNGQARKVRRARRGSWEFQTRYRFEPSASSEPDPESEALEAETRQEVRAAIDRLPPQHAHVLRITLAHDAGLGPEAHVALECSKGTARMQISRARQALVGLLKPEATG